MDMSAHEAGDIPMPITSSYGHAHIIHDHIMPSVAAPQQQQLPSVVNGPISASSPLALDDHHHLPSYKKVIRYRECLKNHAAAMGGNATDGCGEFMPSGEEGTLEALKCSACNCHRNFHRKEMEGEASSCDCYHHHHMNKGRKVVGQKGVLIAAGSEAAFGYPTAGIIPRPHPGMIMSYNLGGLPSESDEQEGGTVARPPQVKKRFRTKFTPEQKEKMLGFAEKVGWRIQKQEESVVQQFCQEIGVKRRVLKVWMHNNKHNLAKKSSTNTTSATSPL